jgi:hypothetical protein
MKTTEQAQVKAMNKNQQEETLNALADSDESIEIIRNARGDPVAILRHTDEEGRPWDRQQVRAWRRLMRSK